MSPQFERVVIITIMSILVSLFTWIYMRDRQQRVGVWLLGWFWILVHFVDLTLLEFKLLPVNPAKLVAIGTLRLAGMSFLLSVSKACATWPRRALVFAFVGIPSIAYVALLVYQTPHLFLYPAILAVVMAASIALVAMYCDMKKPLVWLTLAVCGVPGLWATFQAAAHPRYGLDYLLWGCFAVTGFL